MRKAIRLMVVLALLIFAVSTVYAIGPRFAGMGTDGFCMNYENLTPEQKANIEKFRSDVHDLRDKIHQKMTEIRELRAQATPDWNAIEEKQKEMVEVRTEIQKKAYEAEISGQCRCGGGGMTGMHGRMGMGL